MDLNKLLKSQWDRVGAVVLTVVGAIFLLVGWIGVSGSPYLAEQAPYILSGGVGGIFFLGLGATLWISADLRDEWRKLDRIEQALEDGTLRWADDADGPQGPAGGDQLWSSPQAPPRVAASSNGSSAPAAGVAKTKAAAGKPAAPRSARPRTSSAARES